MNTIIIQGLLACLLLVSSAGAADEVVIADFSAWKDAKAVPPDWDLKIRSGKAGFVVQKDGDVNALQMKCSDSSFSFEKGVKVDVKRYPLLSWKWKVTTLPKGGDFRKSRTDDQAAQLFLAFSRTKAIVYLWDTTAPQGLVGDAAAPFFMTIKAVVVRSGPADLGKWLTETRNVYEDYKKFFGEEPPEVEGIRIQINSQHTGSSAESAFADVVFRRQ